MTEYQEFKPTNKLNRYLLSLFDPRVPSAVPDLNLTSQVEKQIVYSDVLSVVGSGSLLIWIRDKSTQHELIVFGWSETDERYYFLKAITPDQEIGVSYDRERSVSGVIRAKSASYTGTAFTVAGSMNVVGFSQLPKMYQNGDLQSVDFVSFSKVSSSRRNAGSVTTGVPLMEGVVALRHPDNDNNYRPCQVDDDDSTINLTPGGGESGVMNIPKDEFITWSSSLSHTASSGQGWIDSTATPSVNTAIFDTELPGAQKLPPNAMGAFRYRFDFTFQAAAGVGDTMQTYMEILYRYANPVTYEAQTEAILVAFQTKTVGNGVYAVSVSTSTYVPPNHLRYAWIDRVRIFLQPIVGAPYVFQRVQNNSTIEMDFLDMGDGTSHGSGSFIAMEGLNAGQTVTISGVANYQVTPNSTLAKDVKTHINTEPKQFLKAAKLLTAHTDEVGLRWVYSCPDYDALLRGNAFYTYAGLGGASQATMQLGPVRGATHGHMAHAFDLRGGLKRLWTSYLRPMVRKNLSGFGRAVGGVFGGPMGSQIGGQIGSGLVSWMDRNAEHRGVQSGYAYDKKEEEPKKLLYPQHQKLGYKPTNSELALTQYKEQKPQKSGDDRFRAYCFDEEKDNSNNEGMLIARASDTRPSAYELKQEMVKSSFYHEQPQTRIDVESKTWHRFDGTIDDEDAKLEYIDFLVNKVHGIMDLGRAKVLLMYQVKSMKVNQSLESFADEMIKRWVKLKLVSVATRGGTAMYYNFELPETERAILEIAVNNKAHIEDLSEQLKSYPDPEVKAATKRLIQTGRLNLETDGRLTPSK